MLRRDISHHLINPLEANVVRVPWVDQLANRIKLWISCIADMNKSKEELKNLDKTCIKKSTTRKWQICRK